MTVESEKIANGIGRGMAVDLKDYFERLWTEHERRHDRDHEANEEAISKAFEAVRLASSLDKTEVLRRLVELNHSHEQAREKEKDFISREAHRLDIKGLQDKLDDRDKILTLIREELAQTRGRQVAWTAALALAFSLITVALRFLG